MSGELDQSTTPGLWRQLRQELARVSPPVERIVVDGSGVTRCDASGLSLFLEIQRRFADSPIKVTIEGLSDEIKRMLEPYDPQRFVHQPKERARDRSEVEIIGERTWLVMRDLGQLISFVGELSVGMLLALRNPRRIRWGDTMVIAERTGVEALPIVATLGFLVGLIMAFQAAIPMKQFGAELYVADFIGLAMVRELGALITAVILAGRTGSAFAAELGTMKVNEEINALNTMGLDPVRFLVVPRVLATVVMTPLLSVFAILFGLIGGLVVSLSLGFPMVTYINEVRSILSLSDFTGGLAKAFVFGILVAGIGCLRGLQTSAGASAVGQAATRAVVSGIFLIVIADGIFAVVFYFLDL